MENNMNEPPTLWRWYFAWHLRSLLTIPILIFFVYQGIVYSFLLLRDIVLYFRSTQVTWGALIAIFIFGSLFFILLVAPVYICFGSIHYFYQINIEQYPLWKKTLYSLGIILLVFFGTELIRMFTLWVMRLL